MTSFNVYQETCNPMCIIWKVQEQGSPGKTGPLQTFRGKWIAATMFQMSIHSCVNKNKMFKHNKLYSCNLYNNWRPQAGKFFDERVVSAFKARYFFHSCTRYWKEGSRVRTRVGVDKSFHCYPSQCCSVYILSVVASMDQFQERGTWTGPSLD